MIYQRRRAERSRWIQSLGQMFPGGAVRSANPPARLRPPLWLKKLEAVQPDIRTIKSRHMTRGRFVLYDFSVHVGVGTEK